MDVFCVYELSNEYMLYVSGRRYRRRRVADQARLSWSSFVAIAATMIGQRGLWNVVDATGPLRVTGKRKHTSGLVLAGCPELAMGMRRR